MPSTKFLPVAVIALLLTACGEVAPPDVPFLAYGDDYQSKPDLARVEYELPLSPDDLMTLTPENVARLNQEQVDQVYARLTAGPVPDGAYNGTFFFADGGGAKRLSEVMGGIKGLAVRFKLAKLETVGQMLWKGKVFYRDQRLLRNMIQDRKLLKLVVDDPDALPKTDIPGRKIFGLIQDDAWLLFPAKLYCGQSLLDSRRESIIIDYAYNDEIDGYRERPDFLAGRRGLRIRDEIRMVRPGFYLGRAYMGHVFLLNFTLYNEAVAESAAGSFMQTGEVAEDCWPGSQKPGRLVALGR
ncbi:MAG: hypothetical protein KDI22_00870 [Gammaproteobacteria bacterium]|nr:hypothetical protein [Gammaproteobacteria bacterium]MCP5317931.1 hypothetical protein [Chromatiaceae bacterium]MCW5587231.1 hypothetical protein [Chromatiales bacterium]MCB1818667.1 hypothetical protein [Gammaproteobacteria bacterium]MCP5429055.1 hypothetical protein [Chromatiaceae bacterium]